MLIFLSVKIKTNWKGKVDIFYLFDFDFLWQITLQLQ